MEGSVGHLQYTKVMGMLIVSLRGKNGFFSHFKCFEDGKPMFLPMQVSLRVVNEEISWRGLLHWNHDLILEYFLVIW